VSWNKPFKERIRHLYNEMMTTGDGMTYTAAGNPRAPSLEAVLEWVVQAWDGLSNEVVKRSFKGDLFWSLLFIGF
jgi:hypothetical protein